jgi:hypothetical protein
VVSIIYLSPYALFSRWCSQSTCPFMPCDRWAQSTCPFKRAQSTCPFMPLFTDHKAPVPLCLMLQSWWSQSTCPLCLFYAPLMPLVQGGHKAPVPLCSIMPLAFNAPADGPAVPEGGPLRDSAGPQGAVVLHADALHVVADGGHKAPVPLCRSFHYAPSFMPILYIFHFTFLLVSLFFLQFFF